MTDPLFFCPSPSVMNHMEEPRCTKRHRRCSYKHDLVLFVYLRKNMYLCRINQRLNRQMDIKTARNEELFKELFEENYSRLFYVFILMFRKWFKYGLKAQKLLAQGSALGKYRRKPVAL